MRDQGGLAPDGIKLVFTPTRRLAVIGIVPPKAVYLNEGQGQVDLLATDDPTYGDEPWAYRVAEYWPGQDGIYRYVLVPTSENVLSYDELEEVSESATPPGPDTLWWKRMEELETALDSGDLVGPAGPAGAAGPVGLSAYEVAVVGGFVGSEADWLASLRGDPGVGIAFKGTVANAAALPANPNPGDGYVQLDDSHLYVWDGTTWVDGGQMRGPQGATGDPGDAGADGADGLSAYDLAVINGFSGTEIQWLASLVGAQGETGATGATGATGQGVPAGGNAGLVLGKDSATDFDTSWVAAMGLSGDAATSGAVFWGAWTAGSEPTPPDDGKFHWGFELEA